MSGELYCDSCDHWEPVKPEEQMRVRMWFDASDASSAMNKRQLTEQVFVIHRRCFSSHRYERVDD